MSAGIFAIQEDGQLVEMTEEQYSSEDVLQTLLEQYPNLMAGDQIDSDKPRRWLPKVMNLFHTEKFKMTLLRAQLIYRPCWEQCWNLKKLMAQLSLPSLSPPWKMTSSISYSISTLTYP